MKIAYLFPGRDADRRDNPSFFKALEATIAGVKRPETEVTVFTLPGQLPGEAEMAYWYVHPKVFSAMIPAAKRAEKEGYDAVVIGCVGSTDAEYAIKEVLEVPVVGIGESALLLAHVLGQTFSVLTYDNKTAAWIDRVVRERHLEDFCNSVRPLNVSLGEMMVRDAMAKVNRKILREAQLAISLDRAEVLVIGSSGFAGLADYLRKRVDAAVVDPVEAGIKFGEMLADLKSSKNLSQSKVAAYRSSPNTSKVLEKYF